MDKTPIFRNYFISIADELEAKIKAYQRKTLNSQDKGDLCEDFMKDFIADALGDLFKIYRGGNIINSRSNISSQLDIILCRKRTIKIFSDKGLYPIESVMGVFEITSNLTNEKLIKDCNKLLSIPKKGYKFHMDGHLPEKYRNETHNVFRMVIPVNCIFGFTGEINPKWVSVLNGMIQQSDSVGKSLLPSIIAVNKKGLIIKKLQKMDNGQFSIEYKYMDIQFPDFHGEPFGRIVNELYNLSHEEYKMTFDYTPYFNADIEHFLGDDEK